MLSEARTCSVFNIDNEEWSTYGAQRTQPVATARRCYGAESRLT